jgi:hypothetical protein
MQDDCLLAHPAVTHFPVERVLLYFADDGVDGGGGSDVASCY